MASSLGALIGPLFDAGEPPKEAKKRAPKPKKNKTTGGEKSVSAPNQQHGELASALAPAPISTPVERVNDHARNAKVNATQDWVDGRITSKQHSTIHARANHVLMNKGPKGFKGTTGEKAPPKGRRGVW